MGCSKFLESSTRYAHQCHEHLISELLGKPTREQSFHTFSAGSAMIALAAAANGANMLLECMTNEGQVTLPPASDQRRHNSLRVYLWLKKPPNEIAYNDDHGAI